MHVLFVCVCVCLCVHLHYNSFHFIWMIDVKLPWYIHCSVQFSTFALNASSVLYFDFFPIFFAPSFFAIHCNILVLYDFILPLYFKHISLFRWTASFRSSDITSLYWNHLSILWWILSLQSTNHEFMLFFYFSMLFLKKLVPIPSCFSFFFIALF